MILYTTATLARKHNACKPEFNKVAKHLGGVRKYGENTPVSLLTILKASGIKNAIWALGATTEPCEKEARLFAADIAETIALPIFESICPDDDRPRKAIETARRFAHGMATREELEAARDAATAASNTASDAAEAAATDAAWATSNAASDAAWATSNAARAVARAVARAAAWTAVRAAAWGAARNVVSDAAWNAAWNAAWDKITDIFLSHFGEE